MIIDERRIFVTSIQTNYISTPKQINQAQNFLTKLIKMVNLDLPEDVWYISKELKLAKQYQDSQNPKIPLDYTDEKLHNMNNLLEG